MMSHCETVQRITQLTPLGQALAALDALVAPVAPAETELGNALGLTLAADATASARPAHALASRDGWAVRSELTVDAGSYAPAALPALPARVDLGEPLPPETDAVAQFETVLVRDGRAEAVASLAPGEGVLLPGADAIAEQPLRRAGERLRPMDIAVLTAAGLHRVSVRKPRVRVLGIGASSPVIDAAITLIAHAVAAEGGVKLEHARTSNDLEATLRDAGVDALVGVGGTGTGRRDASVATLHRIGNVAFHGVGLSPGETLAFGKVGDLPVLLLPGRFDAALAGWLVFGQRLLAKLCGRVDEDEPPVVLELSRKVASAIGLAEVVPVRRRGHMLEPLASGYLPLAAFAQSDGWILVPPESEGYPQGAPVALRRWP
jgi:molybdopterin molybdotransferase